MNIALDYDGTYTRDPELWDTFVSGAGARGHDVFMVTMRYPHEEIKGPCRVIYTSRQAKLPFVSELGIVVHIWIDDKPHFIYDGAAA